MSDPVDIDTTDLEVARFGGEWQRILDEVIKVDGFGETDTHRVSLLRSAEIEPLSVSPDTSIARAVTLMMQNDFSQLPVLQDSKTVKGMFSWRTLGKRLSLGQECKTVADALEPALVLDLNGLIFEAFAAVSGNDVVLVQNADMQICGIVTAYDVSEIFGILVEPFLLIEEVEKHIRRLLKSCVEEGDLKEAVSSKTWRRGKPQVSDLNFGGYLQLLNKEVIWKRLGLTLDQTVFTEGLSEVKAIRNDVMHFRPRGIGQQKLVRLRNFAKFLRDLKVVSKK
jgi:predicted transcriptional regulator